MARKKTKAEKNEPAKTGKDAERKLPEGNSENFSGKKSNSVVPEAEALPAVRRRKRKGGAWFSQTPYDLGCFSVKDTLTNKLSLFSNVFAIFLGTVLTALLLALLAGTEVYIEDIVTKIPGIRSVSVWIDFSTGEEPFTDQEIKDFEQWEGAEILVPTVNQFVPLFEKEARETIVSLFSTSPGDPELARSKVVAGTLDIDLDGWDIVIPMSVAEELNNFHPKGLAGKKITMQLKRYGSLQDMEKDIASKVYDYPVRVVGVIEHSTDGRVYGSLNMVRFARDFATARSKYLPPPEGKIDIAQISARTRNETLTLHFPNGRAAETAYGKIKNTMGSRFQAAWPGEKMLWLRDVQLVSSAVLVMIGILALVAGSVSIFNSQLATVARKTREIGIQRALGFTRLDVFFIFLGQAVLVGLLACCSGLIVTLFAVKALNVAVSKHWEILAEANEAIGGIFQFDATIGGMLVLAVLILCVLASLLPSLRASGMSPMDALREE